MIDIARSKADANYIKNVTFEQAAIDGYQVADATYDVVMGHGILHLLEDKEAVIAKVFAMLKPGGVFVSNTFCAGGKVRILRLILPVGHYFGLLPLVRFFSVEQLVAALTTAGFGIDHQWQPDGSDGVFIVAKKPV